MIALLVFTDGRRKCIEQTLASAAESLRGPITRRIIWNDAQNPAYERFLNEKYNEDNGYEVHSWSQKMGFGGTIRGAWDHARKHIEEPYVFHLEDDFVFNRPVDLLDMVHVLETQPHVVQLALRRQPWNDQERAAGGVVEQWPDAYEARSNGTSTWLEHRLFFTTNPSLYRRTLIEQHEWPREQHSEGVFTHRLLAADQTLRFAFWGARESGEAVRHIGAERVGNGY